jgi:hypothetical protein
MSFGFIIFLENDATFSGSAFSGSGLSDQADRGMPG